MGKAKVMRKVGKKVIIYGMTPELSLAVFRSIAHKMKNIETGKPAFPWGGCTECGQ